MRLDDCVNVNGFNGPVPLQLLLEPATEIAVAAGAAAPPGIDEVRFVCFDGAVADVYRRILDALRT